MSFGFRDNGKSNGDHYSMLARDFTTVVLLLNGIILLCSEPYCYLCGSDVITCQ